MSSTLRLGRAYAEAFKLSGLNITEDTISVQGMLMYPDPPAAPTPTVPLRTVRAQFAGYDSGTADEEVVPFQLGQDPNLDGFVFVGSAGSQGFGRSSVSDNEPQAISLELVRVRSPLFEVQNLGALRSNSHGITTGTALAWVGYPASATAARLVRATSVTAYSLTGADGNGVVSLGATGTAMYSESLLYGVEPGDFYDCAAELRIGSTRAASSSAPDVSGFHLVTDRQIRNLPTKWLIQNQSVRVLPGPSNGELLIGHWSGSAWGYYSFKLIKDGATGTTTGDADNVSVLYNGPERVTIRLWFDLGSQVASFTDLTVRRGSPIVEGVSKVVGTGATLGHGVGRFTADASTAATGGIIDTTGTPKWRIRTPQAFTADNTNGFIRLTSSAQRFAFGIDVDSFSGIDVTDGYWAGMLHKQTVTIQ